MSSFRVRIIGAALALALPVVINAESGQERWHVLPPTPTLPADTVAHYADIHGARIWYSEWGPSAKGAPVLLLHGGPLNSNYFGQVIPILTAHGYRVIAMDSRGHGRSTRPPGPITYHLMATDVIGLLNHLKVRQVSLVGWSDGGIVGIDLALNQPERLKRLFAFGAIADTSANVEGADSNPVVEAYEARSKDEYRQLSPTPNDWESFHAAMDKMWSSEPNFTAEQLRSIRVPTTIADGQYDEFIKPEHTRRMANTIPGAKLVILPRLSHFAVLQDPAAFGGAILTFLQR